MSPKSWNFGWCLRYTAEVRAPILQKYTCRAPVSRHGQTVAANHGSPKKCCFPELERGIFGCQRPAGGRRNCLMAQPQLLKLPIEKTNPNCSSHGKSSRIRKFEKTNPTRVTAPWAWIRGRMNEPKPKGAEATGQLRRTNERTQTGSYTAAIAALIGERKNRGRPSAP